MIKTKHILKKNALLYLTLLFLLMGCGQFTLQPEQTQAKFISEIAYDITKNEDCIVYIEESGVFAPYLVLTSDYGDNTLLLRQLLLDEPMPYKKNESGLWATNSYASIYKESDIDNYLNTEFMDTLSQFTKDSIVESDILTTDKNNYGGGERIPSTISRKIFLLSLKEIVEKEFTTTVTEGKTLQYFLDDYTRRFADISSGEKASYWTRTPHLWNTYDANIIGYSKIDYQPAHPDLGVRPAFCLDNSTPIIQSEEIISGQTVYILDSTDN